MMDGSGGQFTQQTDAKPFDPKEQRVCGYSHRMSLSRYSEMNRRISAGQKLAIAIKYIHFHKAVFAPMLSMMLAISSGGTFWRMEFSTTSHSRRPPR
jgi:hypothetical protein